MFASFHFNEFDYILLALIGLSSLFGLLRGFIREIVSLVSWVAAFTLAIMFTQSLSLYFEQYIKTPYVAQVLSFLLIMICTLVVGFLVNGILRCFISSAGFVVSNHILGALFGVLRGIVISTFIIFLISISAWREAAWLGNSSIASGLRQPTAWLIEHVKISLPKISLPQIDLPKMDIPNVKIPAVSEESSD